MRLLLAAIALCVASPAIAQQPPQLKIGASEPYRHKPSGLTLPTTLDGLQRTSAVAYVPDLDEALGFDNPANNETLTVYVFRNVTGSVPLWFDRIDWVASHRDIYGGLVSLHAPAAFAPTGQGNASGLIGSYSVSKGPYRSTATAFMPLGPDWYVSVRYSSKTFDAATLETHLRAVVAAIGWPQTTAPQPVAVPVETCTTPLALSGEAKPVRHDKATGGALLFGALMASASSDEKQKMAKDEPTAPPVTWCRDIAASIGMGSSGVYRPVGTKDRYLIAYQDAGRGLMVEPDAVSILIDKKAKPAWSLTEYEVAAAASYIQRDRLPAPDQALKIIKTERTASKATTWGDKRNIQIDPDVLK
ncbi:MAG: hypothetical protein ACRCS5_11940 [Sphingomonas sp.]|uniref:hypothetical protein n=1 Tax=Sphingomonas sp. TaxID=28214 RepID=UPI0030F67502